MAYIKGAKADPSANTISMLNNNNNIIIGASHHFFLTLMKSQNSISMLIFPIEIIIFYIFKFESANYKNLSNIES